MNDAEKNILLLQWLKLCLNKGSLAEKIYARGFTKVAICGLREYGRLFVKELKKENVEIVCIIEKNYQALQGIDHVLEIPIVGFSLDLNHCGAEIIIVTPDLDMIQVRENLELAGVEIPAVGVEWFLL